MARDFTKDLMDAAGVLELARMQQWIDSHAAEFVGYTLEILATPMAGSLKVNWTARFGLHGGEPPQTFYAGLDLYQSIRSAWINRRRDE